MSKSNASFAKSVLANVPENQRLRSADATAAEADQFGRSVAVDGNTVVIGVWGNDSFGADTENGDGAIEVWTRSGSVWSLQQRIEPGDLAQHDAFGWSVAISGDTLVVGSPQADASGADSGAVYVYTRSASVWTQQQKIAGSTTDGGDNFGYSVDVEGNTLIVGAKSDEVATAVPGSAFVFTRSGSVWTQQGRLTATGGQEADAFGSAVRLSGDYAVVGAEYADTLTGEDAGAAYVFKRTAGVWSQQAVLTSNLPDVGARFAHAVAIDGGTIVVSDHLRASAAGRAVVFTGADATWTVQQTLSASDGLPQDYFSHGIAIVGDTLLIGAYQADLDTNVDRGAAYRFTRSGSMWTQIDKYLASDASTTGGTEYFGFDVSLAPGVAAVGAPQDEVVVAGPVTRQDAGAVYMYHLGTPTTTIQIVNPTTAKFGQVISLSAQVNGGTPTGNVEFRDGTTVLATSALNGSFVAAANITPAVGSYSITANYVGDANHIGSSSSATAVTVSKADTSLALNTTGSPTMYGQSVTFTAPISVTLPGAGSPSGNIEFRDNGTLIATQPLIAGQATLNINTLLVNSSNPHPITATYTGSTNYNGSTIGPINHVVNRVQPTMQLNSSLDPSLLGQQLTISAVITGGIPVCFIDFKADNLGDGDPAFDIGGAAVSGNTASITWTPPAVGDYAITATCGGDANQFATNGSGLTQNVLPSADVSVTKTNGTSFVQSGQDTTYTIFVDNPAGGTDTDGLLVNDTLNPAQFDVPNADWSCAPAGICTPESGTGNIANLPLDLPAGSSVTITVTVPVLPEAESGVSNTVSLTMPNGVGDPNLANNTATDSDGSGLFSDSFESGPAN